MELLRRLPAEIMRIDARHFVDAGGDALDQTIADSFVRLSRTLQRMVMVVDLGDEPALDAWKRLGADYFHGLVVARPSPVVFTPNT